MPTFEDWEGVGTLEDSQINTGSVSAILALLCLFELEKEGVVSVPYYGHEESLKGLVCRSRRLKVEQPTDEQVLWAVLSMDMVADLSYEDKDLLVRAIKYVALPKIRAEFDPETADE